MWQFGHFMFETLPTLWAYGGEPMVAHRFGSSDPPAAWQRRLMELAGVPSAPHIVDEHPVRVEHLRVATRPAVVGASASPTAVEIWQRIAMTGYGREDLPRGQGRMVALSRSKLEAARPPRGPKLGRVVTNALALDELWRRNGFEVVYPETLDIDEQMRLLREARVLVGVDGSALHASAFVRPGTPVILVGNRDRPRGNLSQAAIDAAMGNPQAILPWQGTSETSRDIDLEAHERMLRTVLARLPA
jgi:capsular polysaccharide biosynthesis protein